MKKHRKPCHHDWDGFDSSGSDWDGDHHCRKPCVDHRKIRKVDHGRKLDDFCCKKPWRVVIQCVCGKCHEVERKHCCKDW